MIFTLTTVMCDCPTCSCQSKIISRNKDKATVWASAKAGGWVQLEGRQFCPDCAKHLRKPSLDSRAKGNDAHRWKAF